MAGGMGQFVELGGVIELAAQEAIITQLRKVKDSYNLSRIAVAAGAQALADADWMRRNVERIKRTRAAAEERLRKMGFTVPASSSNFVLARLAGRSGSIVRR